VIDLESVKERADLLSLAGHDTELKKVANTEGGEYAGPCPFCGGDDRFHVQPLANPGRWMCRNCTGAKWDTVIGYIAKRDNLDPKNHNDLAEICRRAVGDLPTTSLPRAAHSAIPAYQPPAAEWQAAAHQVISECESELWQPKYAKVLDYLRGRGLQDDTIKRFRLGYCATGRRDSFGRDIAGLWVPRGVVIPCVVAGEVWYLKIRLVPGVPCRCQHCKAVLANPGRCPSCGKDTRYLGVKGNRTAAIFNADQLTGAGLALFCEGEFDCMTAHQVLNDVLPCVTFGSATNRPDLATWGAYLVPLKVILSAYDVDKAGESGAAMLADLAGERVKLAPLPVGVKDINDYHQAGGDLWAWIKPLLEFYDPVEVV
jgi:hypothetical protein